MYNTITVDEFCKNEKISRAMFYKLKKQGLAPKILKIGRLTRITESAVIDWHKKMEQNFCKKNSNTN